MTAKTLVFTSAALNYIPKVRMLFNSLREFHPEIELHLALSDLLPSDVDLSGEPFDEVHPIDTLGIDQWRPWAFCHNIVELSTAIKPFVLQKLLARRDVARVIYFDPDMVLFSRLDDMLDRLVEGDADVVLTPHQTDPDSSLRAVMDNEISSLKHGIYNLGFVGVRTTDEGKRFAKWWGDRIYHFCRADIPNGLFTDQRWVDLAPAFFDGVRILRSPRYNVATWNLTTRLVTGNMNDGFLVNGQPLGFYHFTGFDSGAHHTMAQVNAGAESDIHLLVDWYKRETAALVDDPLSNQTWAFGQYSNGQRIKPIERVIYRERVDLQRAFPKPFDADGGYLQWLTHQAPIEYPGVGTDEPDAALDVLKAQLSVGFQGAA